MWSLGFGVHYIVAQDLLWGNPISGPSMYHVGTWTLGENGGCLGD